MKITSLLFASAACLVGAQRGLCECGDAGSGDCAVAHCTPGCADTACCKMVCAIDPYCCEWQWDAACVSGAAIYCDGDGCPNPKHDCYTTGGPGCSSVACCQLVCDFDSFCCDTAWDSICVDEAWTWCVGGGAEGGPDPTDCCTPHVGTGCSLCACQDAVCAVSPPCCDVAWDGACAALAEVECPTLCPVPVPVTIHVPGDLPTLRAALSAAKDGDEIVIADGVHTGSGFGNLDLQGKAVTVRSANGAAKCIIDLEGASGSESRGFLAVNGEGPDTRLEGLTIRNSWTSDVGGVLKCIGSSPSMEACILESHRAAHGGAISCQASSPVISGCSFLDCRASGIFKGSAGGAISAIEESTLTISDCEFVECIAIAGGGVYLPGGSASFTNCEFRGCIGQFGTGGGLAAFESDVTLQGCLFAENYTDFGGGGAAFDKCEATVDGCTFLRNWGSALYLDSFSFLSEISIVSCRFLGNTAYQGAGIFNSGATVSIINTEFSGNIATWLDLTSVKGGAVYNQGPNPPTFINCTFAGNTVTNLTGNGGAIATNFAPPTLVNCVLWTSGNHPIEGPAMVSYSIVQNGFPGEANLTEDPLFVSEPSPGLDGQWSTPDDDYGDLHVQSGSPCIDSGNDRAVPARILVDLDGLPRFADGNDDRAVIIDRGAYEVQPPPPSPADLDGNGVVDGGDMGLLLAAWGPCPRGNRVTCAADLNGDGIVDGADLGLLLGAWS